MIVVSCSALITKDNSVLLIREKKMDKYGLPGGKLEEGETLRECVMRECQEELGAEVSVDDLFMISEKPKTRENNTVIRFIYRARISNFTSTGELEYNYFNKSEFKNLLDNDLIRGKDVAQLIDDFFESKITTKAEPSLFE